MCASMSLVFLMEGMNTNVCKKCSRIIVKSKGETICGFFGLSLCWLPCQLEVSLLQGLAQELSLMV